MRDVILVPLVSAGGIVFGDSIQNYPSSRYEYTASAGASRYHSYLFTDIPVTAYVEENGEIESVSCEQECIWQGTNLIGLALQDFRTLYPEEPDAVDHAVPVMLAVGEQNQDVYEYDALGVLIWVFDNRIVTVIASANAD